MGVLARLASLVAEMASKLDKLSESGLRGWVEELAALHALQVQRKRCWTWLSGSQQS